ncbi:shikimate dehydrogenase [Syntrophomonas curvata]
MPVDANTRCLGLFGNPVAHSLSPLLHNYTLQMMGLNYVYLPFAIPAGGIKGAVDAIRSLDFCGVNVTIPYKEEVITYLDDISPEAEACGAVNVISNEGGRLRGHNTDGAGFIAALREEGVAVRGSTLLIGAGGAARSLAWALGSAGVTRLDFMDVNLEKAEALAASLAVSDGVALAAHGANKDKFAELAAASNIIINCSPVGMHPHIDQSPVAAMDMLQPGTVVCDIIYNPLNTKFLSMGKARGLKTVSGLPMFVHQAALSLEIWLGIKPPVQQMKEVLRHELE